MVTVRRGIGAGPAEHSAGLASDGSREARFDRVVSTARGRFGLARERHVRQVPASTAKKPVNPLKEKRADKKAKGVTAAAFEPGRESRQR